MNIIKHLDCLDKNEFSIIIFKQFDENKKHIKNIQNIFKENDYNDYLELEILNSLIPSFYNIDIYDISNIYKRSENSIIFIDNIDRKKIFFSLNDSKEDKLFSLFHKKSLEKRNKIKYYRCFKDNKACKILIDIIKLKLLKKESQINSKIQYPILLGLKGNPYFNKFFSYIIHNDNDNDNDKDFNITKTENILDNLINEMIENNNNNNKFHDIDIENKEDIPLFKIKINENINNNNDIDIDYNEFDNKIYNFTAVNLEYELEKREFNEIFIIYTYENNINKEVNIYN
jgi:hypothetical protein